MRSHQTPPSRRWSRRFLNKAVAMRLHGLFQRSDRVDRKTIAPYEDARTIRGHLYRVLTRALVPLLCERARIRRPCVMDAVKTAPFSTIRCPALTGPTLLMAGFDGGG